MTFRSVAEFLDPIEGHRPTTAERQLIKATQAGKDCYLCDRKSPSRPIEATDTTRIRAILLRLLIVGGSKDCGLHERGVSLIGGWIDGPLDIAFCSAQGQIVLLHCVFPEKLRMEESQLSQIILEYSAFSKGIFAQGVRVKGSLFLRNCKSAGTVDVNTARIGGQLVFDGATLDGTKNARGEQQMALNAQGVEVGQDVYLNRLASMGTVAVMSARIGGQFSCEGARFDGGEAANGSQLPALNAHGAETGRDFILNGLIATGSVVIVGTKIGGQFGCEFAFLDGKGGPALEAPRFSVSEGLIFRRVEKTKGWIDLTSGHASDLVDDMQSWPVELGQLSLNGFTYDYLAGTAPITFAARRDWLAAGSHWNGSFHPQPYTQFARVLRQMGHSGEARKVLIEREWLLGKARRSARWKGAVQDRPSFHHELMATIANALDWVADRTVFLVAGYGQDARRSLVWLVGLLLVATTFAHLAWEEGSFAPNSDVVLTSPGWAEATANDCFPVKSLGCEVNPAEMWASTFTAAATTPTQGADWDSFNRYGYAADLVVPFLDLGQTDAWAPSKDRGTWGWWLWWMRWVLATAGWIVTGLGVAAVTGVMQRNQPD